MELNRRGALLGAVAIAGVLSLEGCSSGVTLADVQRYAATAVAAFASIVPLVGTLDPSAAPQLDAILAEVETAEKALAALTSPTGGSSIAETILTLLNQGFSIAEAIPGIPAPYVAAIEAAQILLVTIAAFFGISVTTAMNMPHAKTLWAAGQRYVQASPADRKKLADKANAEIRAWIATLHA